MRARAPIKGPMSLDFAAVLTKMVELAGLRRPPDAGLSAGGPRAGTDRAMDDYPPLDPQDTRDIVYSILNDSQRKRFENQQQLDFAYAIPGVARFRVNCFFQRGSISAVFRHIPTEILTLESLGLPPVLEEFTSKPRGFVLVTGPTGSGQVDDAGLDDRRRSTPSARSTSSRSRTRSSSSTRHKKCIVNQREIGADALDFAHGAEGARCARTPT